jgi:hypothetical protein
MSTKSTILYDGKGLHFYGSNILASVEEVGIC